MLFNSYTFLIFFAFVFLTSRLIKNWKVLKLFLLLMSYLFYSAWNPPFVILLWISTTFDWFIARAMDQAQEPRRRKTLLIVSLLINLGFLGYFKYGGFLLENFVVLVNSLGIAYSPAPPDIVLPVGISFYTFVTLSYTIDVYYRKIHSWPSLLDYALFVTFFPHLVAGPIVRARDFLPQLETPKRGSSLQVGWGLSLFVIGLFYKMVIADSFMAPVAQQIYDSAATPGFFQAWAGTLAFAIQIFCDFAGYSLCAIGAAMSLGFVFPDNFRFPYAAVGFSEFWRHWHITLSTWLRDYLYIPLGGNRKGALRTYLNLMLTMLIGGLWHGASWLFVIWGGLHGVYLVAERGLKELKIARSPIWQHPAAQAFLGLVTFGFVCIAWVFFRAGTLAHAFRILAAMIGLNSFSFASEIWVSNADLLVVLITTIFFLAFHWFMKDRSLEEVSARLPWWTRSVAIALLMAIIVLSFSGEDRAFIYFQF
jgi:D-alanyl-lipoteichoic acid acyltransferase DltB (MBOAT superfamily)